MASYMPAAERPKDGYPAHKHSTPDSRSRLPVIPDLRFEYSYLRSVLPYIKIERSTPASVLTDVHHVDPAHGYERINLPGDLKETDGNEENLFPTPILASEIIHVQWGKVIWITVRDQVVSPLLQGALWLVIFFETFVGYVQCPLTGHWLVTILHQFLHSLVPRWEPLCVNASPQRRVLQLDGYVLGQRVWV